MAEKGKNGNGSRELYAVMKVFDFMKNAAKIYEDAQKEYDEKMKDNNGGAIEMLDAIKEEALKRYNLTQIIEPLIPEKQKKMANWLLSTPVPVLKEMVVKALDLYNGETTTGELITDLTQKAVKKYVLKIDG
jgi:hypothetical protein